MIISRSRTVDQTPVPPPCNEFWHPTGPTTPHRARLRSPARDRRLRRLFRGNSPRHHARTSGQDPHRPTHSRVHPRAPALARTKPATSTQPSPHTNSKPSPPPSPLPMHTTSSAPGQEQADHWPSSATTAPSPSMPTSTSRISGPPSPTSPHAPAPIHTPQTQPPPTHPSPQRPQHPRTNRNLPRRLHHRHPSGAHRRDHVHRIHQQTREKSRPPSRGSRHSHPHASKNHQTTRVRLDIFDHVIPTLSIAGSPPTMPIAGIGRPDRLYGSELLCLWSSAANQRELGWFPTPADYGVTNTQMCWRYGVDW